jgi:hypothetical protein
MRLNLASGVIRRGDDEIMRELCLVLEVGKLAEKADREHQVAAA